MLAFHRTRVVLALVTLVLACDADEDPTPSDDASTQAAVDARTTPVLDAERGDASKVLEEDAATADASERTCAIHDCQRPSFCPMPGSTSETSSPQEDAAGRYLITIKFVEGSHVRLESGTLAIDESAMLPEDPGLLCCSELDVCAAKLALSELETLLVDREVQPIFTRDPRALDTERASGRATSGEYLNDLNLFYGVAVPKPDAPDLLAKLRANQLIDVAYLQAQAGLP